MIEVSREFQEAVRQPVRETRVTGMLRQGTVSFHFGEDAIVQGSLCIIDQMNGGKFGYGSVYSRNVSVKLDYKKIDGLEGVNINLTDMEIGFWFSLKLASGEWEEIPLGWFCVDSAKSSRKFNILTISGGDYLTKLNQPSAAMMNVTPYKIFTLACNKGYMQTGVTENFVKSLPNGEMQVSFDTAQIQTALDMAMWVAELTGTNVKMNRLSSEPKLVQIPIKYTKSNTAGNFDLEEFKKDNGTIIPANVRFSTEFTDTSVRITALIMNRKGKQYKYYNDAWTFAPDTLEGTMEINNNPLLDSASDEDVSNVVKNLQKYTEDLRFCPFKTTFNGNPAIEVGDYVFLETGGAVDETNFRHYGIVTYSKWVYHGKHEIRCATDVTTKRPEDTQVNAQYASSAITSAAANAPVVQDNDNEFFLKPKSQLEKRIDALEGKSGVDIKTAIIVSQYTSEYLKYDYTILPFETTPILCGGRPQNPVICQGYINGIRTYSRLISYVYDKNGDLEYVVWGLYWEFGDGRKGNKSYRCTGDNLTAVPDDGTVTLHSVIYNGTEQNPGLIASNVTFKLNNGVIISDDTFSIQFASLTEAQFAMGITDDYLSKQKVDRTVTKVEKELTPGSVPAEDEV